ncbi:hypothetical protein ABZX92_44745, partial [Lentzea sp. NPDC006480]|uniref:hypothetical protein n=1 Tax=Lentzea sp. NPDC006480 TaxID=3157176 RepID=UPI0033A2CE7D
MYDDVRTVVEEFEYTGDIAALLTADLPPPHECPPDLLTHLAQAHWYQFQAQSGFLGLIDREVATGIAGQPGDPVVAAVQLMPCGGFLSSSRSASRVARSSLAASRPASRIA